MFSNGQEASVPLYIPLAGNDASHRQRANAVARKIGELAAETGEIDPAGWMLKDIIPIRDYLRNALHAAHQTQAGSVGTQFYTYIVPPSTHSSAAFNVLLFDGDLSRHRQQYALSVPPEFQAPDLRAFLDRTVDEVLGADARRHQMKSTAHTETPIDPATVITAMPPSSIKSLPNQMVLAVFRLEPNDEILRCSLGVKEPDIAQKRLEQVNQHIRKALQAGQPLTVEDIQRFCQEFSRKDVARINPSRTGPVIIYQPMGTAATETPTEALRLYTTLQGRPESGFGLGVHPIPANGRGTDRMLTNIVTLPPACHLTMEQAESLRTAARTFVEDRFTAFYLAGGRFRDNDDISFGGRGKPALTPQGANKFHRILEGRLTSSYVQAALQAGIANPFDLLLDPLTVQRIGGFKSLPQPAHSELQLLHPRIIEGDETSGRIRATLLWTRPNGETPFRRDVEFSGIEALMKFNAAIDRWTTDSLAAGDTELPMHACVESLKRICGDHDQKRNR